jgi:hypothetical protein
VHDDLYECDCRDVHDGLVECFVGHLCENLDDCNVMHLMTVLPAMSMDGLKGTVSQESAELLSA